MFKNSVHSDAFKWTLLLRLLLISEAPPISAHCLIRFRRY